MLTEDRLRELEALCEAATPGPWMREHGIIWGDSGRVKVAYSSALTHDVPTLDFIAAARTATPELIAALKDATSAHTALSEVLAKVMQQRDEYAALVTVLRDAAMPAHSAHWDSTGGSGSGCPQCERQRQALAMTPAEALEKERANG